MSLLARAKACPWCGRFEVWIWDKAIPGQFAVSCSNPTCAATGPIRPTEDEAVIAWNAAPRSGRTRNVDGPAVRDMVDELHPPAGIARDLRSG